MPIQILHSRIMVVLLQGHSILKNLQVDCFLQQWQGLYKLLKDSLSRHFSRKCPFKKFMSMAGLLHRNLALARISCNNCHIWGTIKGTVFLSVGMYFFNPECLFFTTELLWMQNSGDQIVLSFSVNSFLLKFSQHSILLAYDAMSQGEHFRMFWRIVLCSS